MLLRVHWQFDALCITLYDQHPSHGSAEKSDECRERRSEKHVVTGDRGRFARR